MTRIRNRSMALVSAAFLVLAGLLVSAVPIAHAAKRPATLRQLAAARHLRIGAAIDTTALANEPTYRRIAGEQFSTVTPENVMKWDTIEPQQGVYDFSQGDALVRFAEQHGQKVRGHNLVWNASLPTWLTSGNFTPAQLREILKQHIFTEVRHWRGKIWAWDVVNEPIDDATGELKHDIWLDKLGPGYIADAFRWAHEADPHAILFVNDFDLEFDGKYYPYYDLITSLLKQGVPIQGVGFEMHYITPYDISTLPIVQHMQGFADLGLDVAVTEMDVGLVMPPTAADLTAQANMYGQAMRDCLAVPRCISFTTWGFTDAHSWIPGFFGSQFGAGLPYDENYQPKPAYYALVDALQRKHCHRQ